MGSPIPIAYALKRYLKGESSFSKLLTSVRQGPTLNIKYERVSWGTVDCAALNYSLTEVSPPALEGAVMSHHDTTQ